MGAIVIRTRYDEGTELAEVATSAVSTCKYYEMDIDVSSYSVILYM